MRKTWQQQAVDVKYISEEEKAFRYRAVNRYAAKKGVQLFCAKCEIGVIKKGHGYAHTRPYFSMKGVAM